MFYVDLSGKGKYDSSLPDIDPDPEVAQDLMMLKDRNQEIVNSHTQPSRLFC